MILGINRNCFFLFSFTLIYIAENIHYFLITHFSNLPINEATNNTAIKTNEKKTKS